MSYKSKQVPFWLPMVLVLLFALLILFGAWLGRKWNEQHLRVKEQFELQKHILKSPYVGNIVKLEDDKLYAYIGDKLWEVVLVKEVE